VSRSPKRVTSDRKRTIRSAEYVERVYLALAEPSAPQSGPTSREPDPVGTEPMPISPEPQPISPEPEPISPELALVSDELGTRARAELPERPWELFAGAPEQPLPLPAAAPPAGVSRRMRLRLLRNSAFLLPVAAAGVVSAVLWFGADRPSSPAPAAAVPPARPAADGNGTPIWGVQGGGYVFDDGLLQVAGDGASVRALRFTRGCARGGVVDGPVPLRGRLFRFAAPLRGSATRVTVTGVFFTPSAATLLIDLRGGECGSQTMRRTARLS
jgi:hypothetical protein